MLTPWRLYIICTNLLTKFHEDGTINVASRVKNAPTPGGHVFHPPRTIFKLVKDIIGINLLTKFNEDRTIKVATKEKCLTPGGHVCQPTKTIFELVQDVIGKNLLTTFLEDWTINFAYRVLTRQMVTPHDRQKATTKAHHEHIALR
ncbi:hypothetical protein DPMN_153580 [Dreissena polymorpha]|uniref:Uncharacterized protein n=1 Tax=Dreissena polymorpha TaxID=45954 RepID=A0A9D4J4Y6_DREPO|nr:hypothetical protein DPMN_153580 [Dreissena polymorpha]